MHTQGLFFSRTYDGDHRGQWDWTPSIPEQLLPTGRVGVPYSHQMLGLGSFSATGMPAGLSVDTTGQITGTPSAVAVDPPVFTVTTAAGREVSRAIPLPVVQPGVVVTTVSLNVATAGVAGSQQLTFAGAGTITATAAGLPGGATMTSGGLLIWDTTVLPGTYTVVVTPSSSTTGAGDPKSFQWRVVSGDTLDPGAWAPHLRTRRG